MTSIIRPIAILKGGERSSSIGRRKQQRERTQTDYHEKKSYEKRYSHLPGSRLWTASFMTNAGNNFSPSYMRNMAEPKEMAEGVGIPKDKNGEIITYDKQGLQGAMGYFVLHCLLGDGNVRLFDGSILESAQDKRSILMETLGYKKHL
jgi:3-mercaptopyruvate sulfurtransferase SseA